MACVKRIERGHHTLVVSYSISKALDCFKTTMHSGRRKPTIRKRAMKARDPKRLLESCCNEVGPESKAQFGDDLTGLCMRARIVNGIVERSLHRGGIGNSPSRPREYHSIAKSVGASRVCSQGRVHAVSDGDFKEMKNAENALGDLDIHLIQFNRVGHVALRGLDVSHEPFGRKNGWCVARQHGRICRWAR